MVQSKTSLRPLICSSRHLWSIIAGVLALASQTFLSLARDRRPVRTGDLCRIVRLDADDTREETSLKNEIVGVFFEAQDEDCVARVGGWG